MTKTPAFGTHLLVSGAVQGVGVRHFVRRTADRHAIAGWVRNLADGRVEAVLVGTGAALQSVMDAVARGPRGARVDEVVTRIAMDEECPAASSPFTIRPTSSGS